MTRGGSSGGAAEKPFTAGTRTAYAAGDLVRLKSPYAPIMVVGGSDAPGQIACLWFDRDNRLQQATLPWWVLTPVPPEWLERYPGGKVRTRQADGSVIETEVA